MKFKVFINGGVGILRQSSVGGQLSGFMTLSDTVSSPTYAARKDYVDASFSALHTDLLTTGTLKASNIVPVFSGDLIKAPGTNNTVLKTGVTPGVYSVLTVNEKGLVTEGRTITSADLPGLDWTNFSSTPTTAGGYGITDALLSTGGAVTGNIALGAAPSLDSHASTKLYIDDQAAILGAPYIKTGDVVVRLTDSVQTGYLRCNGAAVTKAAYGKLYALIGDACTARYAQGLAAGAGQPWKSQGGFNNKQSADLAGWVNASTLPVTSHQAQVVVTKERIYLLGGMTTTASVNTVYTAPVSAAGAIGTWTTAGALPAALAGSQAVVTKNRLYLIGGTINSSATASTYYSTIAADGTLGAWTTGPSLPAARAHAQAVVTKNRVYLLGGYIGTTSVNTIYSASVDASGVIGTWAADGTLPTILSGSKTIVTPYKVYLVGGLRTSTYRNDMYVATINADGTLGGWSASGTLPDTLAYHETVVTQNTAYLFGGFKGTYSSAVYKATVNADGTLGTWITCEAMPNTLARTQAISLSSGLYTLGGFVNGNYSNVISKVSFAGGLNDYSTFYNGTYLYTDTNAFNLPDLTAMDTVAHTFFVKT